MNHRPRHGSAPSAPYMGMVLNTIERKQQYLAHRLRVQNAKSQVNSQPPVPRVKDKVKKELTYMEQLDELKSVIHRKKDARTFTKCPNSAVERHRNAADKQCGCMGVTRKQSVNLVQNAGSRNLAQNAGSRHLVQNAGSRNLVQNAGSRNLVQNVRSRNLAQNVGSRSRIDHVRSRSSVKHAHTPTHTHLRLNVYKNKNIRYMDRNAYEAHSCKCGCHADAYQLQSTSALSTRTRSSHYTQEEDIVAVGCGGGVGDGMGAGDSKPPRRKASSHLDVSDVTMKRYGQLTSLADKKQLRKFLRPRIFMDVEVYGVRPLGRLTIQLYTEACPEVVMEFVRICSMNSKNRINFRRLFPPMWVEGELTLPDCKTLAMPNMEHDMNVLDHGSGAGILSFPSRYLRGCKRHSLNFSISFKPLDVLNGRRIAFGRVRRGLWILDKIQDYGTNSGKPRKDIIVTKCGMLK